MKKNTLIIDVGFSVRTTNILLSHSEDFGVLRPLKSGDKSELTLGHLEGFNVRKMKGFKGAGKVTISEVISFCEQAGIKLAGVEKEPNGHIIITANKNTKSGKILIDLARQLQINDKEIHITRKI